MLKPGETLDLCVWGWVNGLSVRTSDESAVKVSKQLSADGRCAITAVAAHKSQVPMVELAMEGSGVWDYFEASVSTGASPPGFSEQQDYVHPGKQKVRVVAFWSKNASPNTFSRSIEIARLILGRHGLSLEVRPGTMPAAPHILPFNNVVEAGGDIETLRDQVEATGLAQGNALVAIIAPVANILSGGGDEKSAFGWKFPAGKWAREFVVINSAKSSRPGVTLLHEIGHAAGLGHEHGAEGVVVANFMNEPRGSRIAAFTGPGTSMYRSQVIKIANAFFAQ